MPRLPPDIDVVEGGRGPATPQEWPSIAVSRVGDLPMAPTLQVDGSLDIAAACRELARLDVDFALVRDGERLGIISARELRECLLLATPADRIAAKDAASFDLPSVHRETPVSEALRLMAGRRGRPVLVHGAGGDPGLLGPAGLMALVSNLWQAASMQLGHAASLDELQAAAHRVDAMVAQLHRQGARVERIAFLVGELNSSLLGRLWALLAPAELQRRGCLMVMGSEGRGEQIVKTDQDNALLLPDDAGFDGIENVAAAFDAALRRFGYPPCPGDVMVTNPLWRQPLQRFKETLLRWLRAADPPAVMNLAIFMDARAVVGDADLLAQARRFMYDCLVDNDAFYAHFARAAVQFPEGGAWWRRWVGHGPQAGSFDLKKQGTFPIVHGVRALALQGRIDALNTAQRLRLLADREVLPEILARDLGDALQVLIGMKMKVNLRQRELGLPLGNLVRLADLATLERNQLTDCLAVIRPFRRYLRRRFSLDVL